MSERAAVLPRVKAAIDALRDELRARHGWTWLEVTATAEPGARRIELCGEVAVDRLAVRVAEAVQRVAPGWSVDPEGVRPMGGGFWHALPGVVVLWAACPARDEPRRVATELRAQDGPLQRLGGIGGGFAVVRGRDGTVGWLERPLGPVVEAPALPRPHGDDPHALVEAARRWLGVPYRLGGVTEQAVDCSALVQRLAVDQLGVLLPRHSSDQLRVAPRSGPGLGVGDLSFVWTVQEAPHGGPVQSDACGVRRALCHVGIGTGSTVVHASLSRRRVVEEPMEGFLDGARRVRHVPFAELLAFGRRVAGWPSLTAAGIRLGREA